MIRAFLIFLASCSLACGQGLIVNPYVFGVAESQPATLPTNGLLLRLIADEMVLTNNAPIAVWTNTATGSNDAVQADTGRQPVFVTNVVNGKAVARYADGVDVLTVPSFLLPAECALFFVIANNSSGGNATTFKQPNHWNLWLGGTFYEWPSTSFSMTGSEFKLVSTHYRSGSLAIYENGVARAGAAISLSDSTSDLFIGADAAAPGYGLRGDIAAVLIYTNQTGTQRAEIESYLMDYYGITNAPDATIKLFFDGDSLVAPPSWPEMVMTNALIVGGDYELNNVGVSSQTIDQMSADAPYQIDPFTDGGETILGMYEYWNQAGISADGTELFNKIKAYHLARRAAGFTKQIAHTTWHTAASAGGGQGGKCHDASELVRANWQDFAEALVDLDRDDLRADSALDDNIHLTNAGRVIWANLYAPVVDDLANP